MKRFSWLISKYILLSVLPYFVFTWLLLSVILFVQQASRFSDIFLNVSIPTNLVWQLTIALAPNVIAFTCPMAVLVGVIIGLARMQGDSELVSIRAAGVGNFQITFPIILLGIALSFFAIFINLKGVPFAAQIVRRVAVQAAIYKLESPIEPGVFNTEISGYTIYVKGGDLENGTWKNIFIHNRDEKNNTTRLITSKSGRIDFTEESNELVLENAVITTFSPGKENEKNKLISENVGQIRWAIQTKRGELIEKLTTSEPSPDELGLTELAAYIQNKEGKEKTEAQVLWLRRILLSITPLIFAVFGTALILRFNRGGRGLGIFLALASLVGYYLIALLGEQLARTGKIHVLAGGFLPVMVSVILILWLFLSNRFFLSNPFRSVGKNININFKREARKISRKNYFLDLTAGILDFDIVLSLLKYSFLTLGFLSSIYIIFTAFELWKFAGTIDNGVTLLSKYLLFLLPFIYIQLAPSALMIAILATYVIKSRQNEIVTWTAAGQSVYRLLLPCFLLMAVFGLLNWQIQERILPNTNQIQDELRSQIRNRGISAKKEGKYWVANNDRIYSFEIADRSFAPNPKIKNLVIYNFTENDSRLRSVYMIPEAVWDSNKIKFGTSVDLNVFENGRVTNQTLSGGEISEPVNPFNELYKKPTHLSSEETKQQMQTSESEVEQRNYAVALEKKYTTPILPLVITLFTSPFALSLSRKGKVITVGYAVAVWLFFMGMSSMFEQLGINGYILPEFAVWIPMIVFALLGIYLLSRIKT
jgi:LPS export ABC transporter permease LptG